ncbi:MAG: TlpA family protein disulfide reductase [Dehalococcoidia bacterium]|nr:TlpA family protein disulfide reductase [Dehalococcoidia bacterium]
MTNTDAQSRQWTGIAVLALALVVAAAAGAFLLFTGGGEKPGSSPESALRTMYGAINDGDRAAFEAALAPDVRDSGQAALVAFPATLGAYEPADDIERAQVSALSFRSLGEQQGWALVGVSGKVEVGGEERDFSETAYVQQIGDRWLVSTQAVFLARAGEEPSPAQSSDGLGPLGPDRPEIGELAPDFALVDARDGTRVRKLSDFRGTPVVVNWYASWCGPCKEEIPEFQGAQDALGDQVVFLGVNAKETADRAQQILELFGATYPAVLDTEGAVGQHYRVSALPHTVFVDAEGVLRAIKVGQVHASDLEDNLAKIGLTYSTD